MQLLHFFFTNFAKSYGFRSFWVLSFCHFVLSENLCPGCAPELEIADFVEKLQICIFANFLKDFNGICYRKCSFCIFFFTNFAKSYEFRSFWVLSFCYFLLNENRCPGCAPELDIADFLEKLQICNFANFLKDFKGICYRKTGSHFFAADWVQC